MNADPPRRLLSIGEFAAATQLSLKALRLYDEQCLLRPATVDAATGYRYYRHERISRTNGCLGMSDKWESVNTRGEIGWRAGGGRFLPPGSGQAGTGPAWGEFMRSSRNTGDTSLARFTAQLAPGGGLACAGPGHNRPLLATERRAGRPLLVSRHRTTLSATRTTRAGETHPVQGAPIGKWTPAWQQAGRAITGNLFTFGKPVASLRRWSWAWRTTAIRNPWLPDCAASGWHGSSNS